MPMPARVVKNRLLKELSTKSEREKIQLLNRTLAELPGYTSGPYGKLRNWIRDELAATQTRSGVTHQESFAVKKEGDAQIALVGPPNGGKSSLLRALTGRSVRVGDYPFTTLKPVAATINVDGALLQLVEVPGLIEGAAEGRGNGRAMLSAVRVADAAVYVTELSPQGLQQLITVQTELEKAGIEVPPLIVGTKLDLSGASTSLQQLRGAYAEVRIVPVSTQTGEGLDVLHRELWSISGLIRVFPAVESRRGGGADQEAIILPHGSTVIDFASRIHAEVADSLRQARVWGPSAKFGGQVVAFDHVLVDGDRVELKTR